jgi:hypothetical protein
MPEPEMSQWGERLRERTLPLQPDDYLYGWTHAILCEALAKPYQQIVELIDPPEPYPPWGPLFDLYACPDWALPWLAQLVGIRLPAGATSAEVRRIIKHAAGHNVGTVAAIRASLEATLVSANPPTPPTIYFRERDGSAYRLEVVTLDPETPDPALTQMVLESVVPGGLVLDYRHIEGWDYQAMTDEYVGYTYADLAGDFANYRDLTQHIHTGSQPGGPRLSTVTPNAAQRLTPLTLAFTGTFPDDMTGFTAEVKVEMELLPAEGFQVVKVSDTECTADGTPPHVGIEQVGTVCILDAAGQPYTNTLPITITLDPPPPPPPSLDTVTPASANVNAFQTLRLTGWFPDIVDFEAFNYNALVTASNGTTQDTSNAVTVVTNVGGVPTVVDAGIFIGGDMPAGTGTIQLCHASDPGQLYANPLPLEIVVPPPPLGGVDTVTPDVGPTTGGTDITISGVGFASATGVDFNWAWAATNFVVVDDATITCTTPANNGQPMTCEVRVLRPEGNLSHMGFTYQVPPPPVPTITIPNPQGARNDRFSIDGTGLANVVSIDFTRSGTAYPCTLPPITNTDVRVESQVPNAIVTLNTSYDVTVTTAGGTSNAVPFYVSSASPGEVA